ncbi:alpha/beta hydrolase [Bradyrhizobium sp. 76]|uniref:alpha/beta fold hydrolase n=1 Tax=Bradyrhizobium sp. 76 TaxID=2782680 RepID=UPI003209F302
MPHALTKDNCRLYFEEAGTGTPIIFLHEFAADYTNWEPQMRYFSRGHRCITYSARGYTPSDVPDGDVYGYTHFYTDALAVLDHLKIDRAHFVGLSMGAYSSLQIGLDAPQRALSMTLVGVGSGSEIDNLDAWRKQCRTNAEQFEMLGSAEVAKVTREAPSRIPLPGEGPARPRRFLRRPGAARRQGIGADDARLPGRPSLDLYDDGRDQSGHDAGTHHLRRRGRSVRGRKPVPEEASACGRARHVSEVRPRAQSRRACAVQRNGGTVRHAGGSGAMGGARS